MSGNHHSGFPSHHIEGHHYQLPPPAGIICGLPPTAPHAGVRLQAPLLNQMVTSQMHHPYSPTLPPSPYRHDDHGTKHHRYFDSHGASDDERMTAMGMPGLSHSTHTIDSHTSTEMLLSASHSSSGHHRPLDHPPTYPLSPITTERVPPPPQLHHHRPPPQSTNYYRDTQSNADSLSPTSASGPPSVVGQPGMPPPAPRPRGPKLKFTPTEDNLLIELKENKNLTWKQIADFFPGRTSGTLQVRYCTKLKAKATVWTDDAVQRLRTAMEEYENDRWRLIAIKVGNGFSPTACREKAAELDVFLGVEQRQHESPP